MLRLSIALKRRADLTRAEFLEYWRNQHAPLVNSLARDLGINRYVQIHSLLTEELIAMGLPVDDGDGFDGLAEVWFDRSHAMGRANTPESKAARRQLREDEARFIATESSVAWWGAAHVIIKGS